MKIRQITHYQKFFSTLCALITTMALVLPAAAEESPSGFSIKAILPENQISDASYFDLMLSPGEEQTVQLEIMNTEPVPILANVELNPASTSLNGTIIYSNPDARDASMAVSIGEIATVRESTAEVPANGSALVSIDIKMTDMEIDGTILGGLRVTAEYPDIKESNSEASELEQGVQINNKYAYVIGLKLSQNNTEVKPDFHLLGIAPRLVNHSTSVAIVIQNSEAAIAKDLRFSARIYAKDSEEILNQMEKDDAEMAPNSSCEYLVDWENRRIDPGTYRALLRMEHQEQVWEWDEEFTVEADDADEVNNGALGLEEEPVRSIWIFWVLALLLLIILVLLYFLLRRRKQRLR